MIIFTYLIQYTAIISTANLVIAAKTQLKEKILLFHGGIPNVVA